MRVKIKDAWYEATLDTPIMVELDAEDKRRIAAMDPRNSRYALFDPDTFPTVEERRAWMNEGAKERP